MGEFYWKRHPDGPFATLIRIATTYLHPEADDLESLQRLARRENDKEMHTFKAELRQAIKDPANFRMTSCRSTYGTRTAIRRHSCAVSGETSTATRQLRRPSMPELLPSSQE